MIWYLIVVVAGNYGHMTFMNEVDCIKSKTMVESVVEARNQTAIVFCTSDEKYAKEKYIHE